MNYQPKLDTAWDTFALWRWASWGTLLPQSNALVRNTVLGFMGMSLWFKSSSWDQEGILRLELPNWNSPDWISCINSHFKYTLCNKQNRKKSISVWLSEYSTLGILLEFSIISKKELCINSQQSSKDGLKVIMGSLTSSLIMISWGIKNSISW